MALPILLAVGFLTLIALSLTSIWLHERAQRNAERAITAHAGEQCDAVAAAHELMPQYKDFGFQPPRLEAVAQNADEKEDNCNHATIML